MQRILTDKQAEDLQTRLNKVRKTHEKQLDKKIKKAADEFYKHLDFKDEMARIEFERNKTINDNSQFIIKFISSEKTAFFRNEASFPDRERTWAEKFLLNHPSIKDYGTWDIKMDYRTSIQMVQGTYEEACLHAITLPLFRPSGNLSHLIVLLDSNTKFTKLS